MRHLLFALGVLFVMAAGPVRASNQVFDGRINTIGEDHIVMFVGDRPMTFKLARYSYEYGFKTKYFTEFGYETSYETLHGTGFVDRARVQVRDGVVSRLDIIRLQPE
jgi:hypothetical protein